MDEMHTILANTVQEKEGEIAVLKQQLEATQTQLAALATSHEPCGELIAKLQADAERYQHEAEGANKTLATLLESEDTEREAFG